MRNYAARTDTQINGFNIVSNIVQGEENNPDILEISHQRIDGDYDILGTCEIWAFLPPLVLAQFISCFINSNKAVNELIKGSVSDVDILEDQAAKKEAKKLNIKNELGNFFFKSIAFS